MDKFLDEAFTAAATPEPEDAPSSSSDISTPDIMKLAADPLHQAMSSHDLVQDQNTAMALDQIKTQKPDLYAKALDYAGITDVPTDVIYRNIDQFEGQDRLIAARKVLESNPAIADWFANGDNHKVVDAPDLSRLSGLSWLSRSTSESYNEGNRTVRKLELGFKDMFNASDDSDRAELERLEWMQPENLAPGNMVQEGYVGAVNQIPTLLQMGKTSLEFGGAGVVTGAAAGAIAGGGTPAEGITIPALATSSGVAGLKIGAAFESFRLNSAEAYLEYRNLKDAAGVKMDNDTARGAAIIVGTLSAGLDVVGLSAMAKTLPGFDQIRKLGTKAAVKELIKEQGFKEIAAKVGKRFAEGVAVETLTEMGQEITKIIGGEAIKTAKNAGGAKFEHADPAAAAQQVLDVGRQTALATMFLVGASSVTTLGYDMASAKNVAPKDFKILQGLFASSADDALVKRAPAKAASAVAAALEGSGKETVYIPLEKVTEMLQDDKISAGMNKIPKIQEAIVEAQATGNPVAIPTGDFYAYVMPIKGVDQVVAMDTKFGVDALSAKEAEEITAKVDELKKAWEADKAKAENPVKGPIYQDILTKASSLGFNAENASHYAALYESFFITMANATSQPVEELYRKYEIAMSQQEDFVPSGNELLQRKFNSGTYGYKAKRYWRTAKNPLKTAKAMLAQSTVAPDFVLPEDGKFKMSDGTEAVATTRTDLQGNKKLHIVSQSGEFSVLLSHRKDAGVVAVEHAYSSPMLNERAPLRTEFIKKAQKFVKAKLHPDTKASFSQGGYDMMNDVNPDAMGPFKEQYDTEMGVHYAVRSSYVRELLQGAVTPKLGRLFRKGVTTELGKYTPVEDKTAPPSNTEARVKFEGVSGNVGDITLLVEPDGRLVVNNVALTKTGTGEGPKIYSDLSKITGTEIWPSKSLSPQAMGMWKKMAPDKVADYTEEQDGSFTRPELTQAGDNVVRGAVRMGDNKFLIRLFKHQNMSTLLHETGHVFLEVMRDAALSATASPQLKEDFALLQDYLGEKGPKFSVNAHEKFARSFEAFLMEGTAPSGPLERPFYAFRTWLMAVYRKVANLNVQLNPNIRGVFDRMLAGDAAIDEEARLAGLAPTFNSAEEAGMSDEAFAHYLSSVEAVKEMARRQLQQKMLGDAAKAVSKENTEARKKVSREVNEELSALRVYRAQRWLRGQTVIPGLTRVRLDRAEVEKIMGVGKLKVIPGGSQMWAKAKDEKVFITVDGDTHVYDDKSSRRRPDANGENGGVKSQSTIYVTQEAANKLEGFFDPNKPRVLHVDKETGDAGLVHLDGRWKGKTEKKTRVKFFKEPAVGLVPVEIWDKGAAIKMAGPIQSLAHEKEEVVHPDVAAAMFGYESGGEMLADFSTSPPLSVAVANEVEKRMAPIIDAQLKTTEQIRQQAGVEMKNDIYRQFVLTDVRALFKLLGTDFDEAQIRVFPEAARKIVRSKTFGDASRRGFVSQYTQADRRLNKLLAEAIKSKDWEEAAALRLKQLFNSYLSEEAQKAHQETRHLSTWVKKYAKKSAKNIDQAYLSQIRGILIRYGFMKGQIDEAASNFSQFLDDEIEQRVPLVVDPALRNPTPRAYALLTVDEVSAIRNTISNLDYAGRNKRNVLKEGKKFDLQLAVSSIVDNATTNLKAPKASLNFNPSWFDTKKAAVREFFVTSLLKIEQLCDWIDGGAVNGPAHKYIFQPMADAQVHERTLMLDYSDKILKIIETKPRSYYNESVMIDAIGKTMRREEIIAVALNLGNQSNTDRIKAGYGWSDQQLFAISKQLDEQDWKNVQAIWNLVDSLWPSVRAVAARIGMSMPDKIEPSPVHTEFGMFAGGYYPVMYDPRKTAEIQRRQMASKAEEMFGIELHSLFPSAGFAKDRSSSFAAPLLLELSVLPTHVSRVIHWTTHAEAMESVSKIVRNKDFAAMLNSYFGEGAIPAMDGWLNNLSRGEQGVKGLTQWESLFGAMRRNVTLMGLGLRATTTIMQVGGLFSGSEMIGGSAVAKGILSIFGSSSISEIMANINEVKNKSGEMRHRTAFLERDLNDVSLAMSSYGVFMKKIRDGAMAPIALADTLFSVPIWKGAYMKALEAGHSEKDAVAYADKVIRLTQGSGAAKDLSAVQRGGEFMRFMTMFYTCFSAYQNRLMDIVRTGAGQEQQYNGMDRPNVVMRWVYLSVLPTLALDIFLRGMLKGDVDDKKPDELAKEAVLRLIAYQFAGTPFVRDGVSYLTRVQDHFEYTYSPVVSALSKTAEAWDKAIKASLDKDKQLTGKQALNVASYTLGYGLGLPAEALATPIHNAMKAEQTGEPFTFSDLLIRR